jgi:S1-C subfamily serine protease
MTSCTLPWNSDVSSASHMGAQEVFYQAFAEATHNMLANDEFYKLVALDKELPKEKLEEELKEIKIAYKKLLQESTDKEKIIGRMRMAVVTIFAGDGHGSGFLISEDGYVLTNEHVVSKARFVTVKFVTGREVIGEIIRVNKVRDVALIKLEEDIYPYLFLGDSSKIKISDEIYAIGTPLLEDFSQTVTKGIISSFRIKDDIRYIQSDVNIQPGNSGGPLVSQRHGVVGISVSGVGFGPITIGLNYFIPVEEAIGALKIIQK